MKEGTKIKTKRKKINAEERERNKERDVERKIENDRLIKEERKGCAEGIRDGEKESE